MLNIKTSHSADHPPTAGRHSRERIRGTSMVAFVLTIAPSVAVAGIIGPPGDTHSWTGAVNASWHNSGNWNTNQVPMAGDAAIILGGANNVTLFASTPAIDSLFIGGGRSVSNNGHVLNVSGGDATTTVTGAGSSLNLTPNDTNFGLMTGTLSIESDAGLLLSGGSVLATEQFSLLSGGQVTGHGAIEVASPNAAAFNGLAGGWIQVTGGDLHIVVENGGSMVLPDVIEILEPGHELLLTGPVFVPINDVNIGSDTGLSVSDNWTLDGHMNVDTEADAWSFIGGNGSLTVDGTIALANGSQLRLESVARFQESSAISIGTNATLQIDNWHDTDPGHHTTVGMNGRLWIDAPHFAGGWQGDIISTAGVIDASGATSLLISGDLTLGSVFGLRSRITGTADVFALGNVNAPGLGAVIDGTLDLRPLATMTLGVNTQIITNGELILREDSDTLGGGQMIVNDGGTLFMEEGASLDADILNHGSFHAGTFANEHYVYIDGTFVQSPSGTLTVHLGGPSNTDRDIYETSEGVSLSGQLVVALTDGFQPNVGEEFEIIWANGGVAGTFDSVAGEPGFSVSYVGNIVTIVYEGVDTCPADLNDDGLVNVVDLLVVLGSWGACDGCDADVNQSGTVDVVDLLAILSAWGPCS